MNSVRRVRDLMRPAVAMLKENDQLLIADDVMRLGRVRHLPIIDDDEKLVGILSQRDLLRGALARTLGYGEHGQRKLMGILAVKEVMTRDVATIEPDAHIHDAARVMLDRKIGSLVVVDEGRAVGILTESDFVRFVGEPA